jgi:NADPH:quinone reductase
MTYARVVVSHYGGPAELRMVEEEAPEPKRGEVRVTVLAAGVSLPDVMMREGIHPETPRLPFTPGWDLVGEVDRLGDGVSGMQPGQLVAALPIHGAYAELICLPQRELVPVPTGVDAAEAVSLVLNYITAYQMMHRSAHVRPGQRVLIHGAAGGVGTALLQLGRLAGLEMYGTCSSGGRRPFPSWAVLRLITSIRTSWRKYTASRAREWTWSSIPSVVPTSGIPARLSVLAGESWVMALETRCVGRD